MNKSSIIKRALAEFITINLVSSGFVTTKHPNEGAATKKQNVQSIRTERSNAAWTKIFIYVIEEFRLLQIHLSALILFIKKINDVQQMFRLLKLKWLTCNILFMAYT